MSTERNCAFQYAKITDSLFSSRTTIVCDKTGLTLKEAIELWNQYYPDAAKWIKDGNSVEMVIWTDMSDPSSYGKHLHYISHNAESDGHRIWETTKNYFPAKIEAATQKLTTN